MEKKCLKDYFPMIRTREEIMSEIWLNPKLKSIYDEHRPDEWEEMLDFCTGAKGVKVLYDSFFKEVFNPEYAPERLSDFLSAILGQNVKIIQVLPNDTTRISDEYTLLVTDIVVELEDRSIVNIEIQKIGYMFPGHRAACYSADLLLRQYKRLRDEKKKKFSYRDIKPVYTIVLFEKSPSEFVQAGKEYFHYMKARSDTGVEMELLQEYYFICLDIFKEKVQNEGMNNRRDAWLTFLCEDDVDIIVQLLEAYPEFKPLYEDIYELCLNMEDVMGLFSKELQILDRNTVELMIDEMQKDLNEKQKDLDEKKLQLKEYNRQLIEKQEQLVEREKQLSQKSKELSQKDEELSQKDEELSQKDEELSQKDEELSQKEEQITMLKKQLEELRK